jgi:hypothetical protein
MILGNSEVAPTARIGVRVRTDAQVSSVHVGMGSILVCCVPGVKLAYRCRIVTLDSGDSDWRRSSIPPAPPVSPRE